VRLGLEEDHVTVSPVRPSSDLDADADAKEHG